LHQRNLIALYKQIYGKLPERSPDDEYDYYEEDEAEEEE
jgi:hypothetical protein